eukprot:4278640-Lingulodinium_polyedra.AAC.1
MVPIFQRWFACLPVGFAGTMHRHMLCAALLCHHIHHSFVSARVAGRCRAVSSRADACPGEASKVCKFGPPTPFVSCRRLVRRRKVGDALDHEIWKEPDVVIAPNMSQQLLPENAAEPDPEASEEASGRGTLPAPSTGRCACRGNCGQRRCRPNGGLGVGEERARA